MGAERATDMAENNFGKTIGEANADILDKKEAAAAGEGTIDAATAHDEARGYIKGERKEKAEEVLNKIWELIKSEGLSISQARYVSQGLSSKVEREKEKVFANATIK